MALEVNDWIETGKKYAGGYAAWFFCTITTPWKTSPALIRQGAPAEPAPAVGAASVAAATVAASGVAESRSASTLAADLSVIVAISIFIGATIGATIPGRPKFADRATVLVVVCGVWIFLGLIIHLVCRLLRGEGTLGASVVAIVQALAAVYVASNLVTMILVRSAGAFLADSGVGDLLAKNPGGALVLLQCVALLYYIPASLAAIHRFRRVALVVVALFSALCSLVIFLPIATAGGCAGPETIGESTALR